MKTELSILTLLVNLITLVSCQGQGEIRLTGWSDGSGGRLEVYLNGKWGTVSRQTDPHDNDLHLGFGKTVCYQINHYNGDDSSIFTGTVTSLNNYLQNTPGKALIKPNASLHQVLQDLKCTNGKDKNPRHILQCSYKIPYDVENVDPKEDLAVLCPQNVSNYDNPYPGQFRLAIWDYVSNTFYNNKFDPSSGYILVYTQNSWLPVSEPFNAFETLCHELGYTYHRGTSKKRAVTRVHYIKLHSTSCTISDVCLKQCLDKSDADKLYSNRATNSSGKPLIPRVTCTYRSIFIPPADTVTPTINDTCQLYVPPSSVAVNGSVIAISITVSVVMAICIAIATTMLICCFNKKCFLYQQRKKAKYDAM